MRRILSVALSLLILPIVSSALISCAKQTPVSGPVRKEA